MFGTTGVFRVPNQSEMRLFETIFFATGTGHDGLANRSSNSHGPGLVSWFLALVAVIARAFSSPQ